MPLYRSEGAAIFKYYTRLSQTAVQADAGSKSKISLTFCVNDPRI